MPETQSSTTTDTTAKTSKEEDKNSAAATSDAETQPATTKPETSEAKFTQAEVTRIVKKEIDAERTRLKKTSEESAALARGEFEKLATTYKADLDRLTAEHDTLVETHQQLVGQVQDLVKVEMKSLPDMVRDLAPSEDALALLAWLPKAKKSAESMTNAKTPTEKGNDRGPKPTGTNSGDDAKAIKEALRSRGRYTGF
jgi:hypothetical protein